MYNYTFKIARNGVIRSFDADTDDPIFKNGLYTSGGTFSALFNSSHTDLLSGFLTRAFDSGRLQCIEFYYGDDFYQLKCIRTQADEALCIITNNTKHSQLLKELETHNLQTIVDAYVDSVWSFDRNYSLVVANKAFKTTRRLLDQQELKIGDNIFMYVKDETFKKWLPIYKRVLNGESIFFEEKRLRDNEDQYVEIYLTPVCSKFNSVIGVLGITRDVTERKKAQQVIEVYAAELEEFAFKTSHELRRPVANLMSLAPLMDMDSENVADKAMSKHYMDESIAQLDEIVTGMAQLIQQYKTKLSREQESLK